MDNNRRTKTSGNNTQPNVARIIRRKLERNRLIVMFGLVGDLMGQGKIGFQRQETGLAMFWRHWTGRQPPRIHEEGLEDTVRW